MSRLSWPPTGWLLLRCQHTLCPISHFVQKSCNAVDLINLTGAYWVKRWATLNKVFLLLECICSTNLALRPSSRLTYALYIVANTSTCVFVVGRDHELNKATRNFQPSCQTSNVYTATWTWFSTTGTSQVEILSTTWRFVSGVESDNIRIGNTDCDPGYWACGKIYQAALGLYAGHRENTIKLMETMLMKFDTERDRACQRVCQTVCQRVSYLTLLWVTMTMTESVFQIAKLLSVT